MRQMISQAIPQALMALFTIVVTFISMLVLSPLLTILAVVIIFVMLAVTGRIGAKSGKYFVHQQMSLADVTGFVEERMNGQRVVKVFNHEAKSKEEFDQLNEVLFESASQANKYGNMMGPVIGNIGKPAVCTDGGSRRNPFCSRHRRNHTWCYGFLSAVHQKLHSAVHAGGTAV